MYFIAVVDWDLALCALLQCAVLIVQCCVQLAGPGTQWPLSPPHPAAAPGVSCSPLPHCNPEVDSCHWKNQEDASCWLLCTAPRI